MSIVEGKNYKTLQMLLKDATWTINPVLYLNQKNDDGKREKVECKRWYEWEFVRISKRSYANKDREVVPGFEITLRDDKDWEVRLQTAWTNPSRSIANSLAWWTWEIRTLRISVWAREKNWRVFANAYLNINGEQSSWLLSIEEQEKLVTKILDPDTQEVIKRKYTKLEAFLETKYDEINAKVSKSEKPTSIVEEKLFDKIDSKKLDTSTESDELPF